MRAVYGALLTLIVLSLSTDAQNNNTRCVVDIALVIDMSGSIMDTDAGNWARQMAFVKQLIRSLRVGKDLTRVGAVTFGNAAHLHFTLDQYNTKQEYLDAVDRIMYYGGNTNTTGGLLVARDQILSEKGGDRPDITDLILLITDGNPTRMVDELPRVAASIRDRGVRIIGVGVTDQVNQKLFRTIVTSPFAENYFNVTDFSSLMDILDAVIFASCRAVPPTPAPAPTAPPAGVCVSIVDLVVVLDVSGSVGEVNFAKLKMFISGLIRELDVESGRVRIGLSTFSDVVRNHFHLETFKARLDMVAAVEQIPYTRGSTNTAAAIRYARDIMLSTARGGRGAAARSVVVMVTDGASNDKEQTLRQAFLSKAAHVHTVVVALGGWTDMEELIGMASHPYRKNLFAVAGADALHDITHSLRDIICNNVNECLANPCLRGGRCVDGVGSYTCLCTSGIAGANCETRCRVASDVLFAMDGSGSVGQLNFQKQIDFVKSVLMGFNLHTDTRAAVMTFSDNAKVKFYLNNFTSVSDVMEAMSFYYEGGTTNTAGALSVMRDEVFVTAAGDRPGRPNIGVVFNDGRSDEEMATWRAAMEAREAGVHLIVLGVGVKVNEREIKGIASEPVDANTFRAASFSELDTVRTRLLDTICNEVNDCEPDPCLNGGRCLDLLGGYRCECVTGYSGGKCQRACDGMLDIVFAIDASGSIRRERFPYILRFVEQLVEQLEVREGRTRIGALTWSDTTQVQFQLNRYSSRQDVLHHLRHIQFTGGRTNTSSALRRIKDEMFTAANGARQDAQNILVMVTDGNSNVDPHTTIPDAIDARSKGVHITVVAVGTQLNELELRGIASSPARQNVYTVKSYRQLNTILPNIGSAVCNALDECASSPCANGGKCVDGFRKYTCMCRPDWTGETCTRQCRRQMDVVFLLDLSGSTDDVYDLCIALTRSIIAGLPIRFDRARVGLVSFADKATTNFYLDTYTTKEEILNAISFRTAGGKTNTQGGIQMATDHVFTASRGDRAGVDDVMVVITDGHSNVRREETESTAARAMAGGIELFVVAVGPSPDMAQVHSIASDPDSEHVQRAAGHREVPAAAASLLGQLCQN